MCIPKGKDRQNQTNTKTSVKASDPEQLVGTCELSKKAKQPDPKLTALEVTGATLIAGDHYWVLRDDRAKVRVKAVTQPSGTPVTWSGGTATSSPIVREVDISVV